MNAVQLAGVTKAFGSTRVLTDVQLCVPEGSITAILGRSGSGKTTLLRLVAGFERADSGRIDISGRTVDDGRRRVHPQNRGVGYVPQEGALFPHLTVLGNVAFGLPRRSRPQARALIDLVGLSGMDKRYPHQLSGGQQQRVALARALAIRPKVVLLDEPFSSLDATLRTSVRGDVARILTETGTTALLVTHDQDEALDVADQIAVLSHGRVVAAGSPRALYDDPPTPAAAAYIGDANLLAAQIDANIASSALGPIPLQPGHQAIVDGPAVILLRPEQLVVSPDRVPGATAVTIVEFHYHGHDALASVTLDRSPPNAQPLLARVGGELALVSGQRVWVRVAGTTRAWPTDAPNSLVY